MKRCWIGLGLLLIVLAAGIGAGVLMDQIHAPVAWKLEQAADYAMVGLWQEAADCAAEAQADWDKWSRTRESLADHTPVEDAEAIFVQLPVFAAEEDIHFAALCRELARKVLAVGETHGFSWSNLL